MKFPKIAARNFLQSKQSFRLYCRQFLNKNCFAQRGKWNGIFWCKVFSADYFYGIPKSLLCNFELREVYLNLLRIKFKHYLHQRWLKSHKKEYPPFSKIHINLDKFHVHQCQAQIEIWRSPVIHLTFTWHLPDTHLNLTWPPDHHLTFPWPLRDPYLT